MDAIQNLDIFEIHSDDGKYISALVKLHLHTFPTGLIRQLGGKFVEEYYNTLVNSNQCGVFACFDKELIGFISYTTNNENPDLKQLMKIAKQEVLKKLTTLRLSPVVIIRSFIKSKMGKKVHGFPELMSIAIDPEYRRSGLGKQLLSHMERRLVDLECFEYCVFTDNLEGIQFYKKNAFTQIFEFNLFGVTSSCLLKKLETESL